MSAETIDLSALSTPQKVALMERLWVALSQSTEPPQPPSWHIHELAQREGEWNDRTNVAEDWAAVREALRQDLP